MRGKVVVTAALRIAGLCDTVDLLQVQHTAVRSPIARFCRFVRASCGLWHTDTDAAGQVMRSLRSAFPREPPKATLEKRDERATVRAHLQ